MKRNKLSKDEMNWLPRSVCLWCEQKAYASPHGCYEERSRFSGTAYQSAQVEVKP